MQVNTPAITDTNAPNVLIVASISGSIETKNPLLDITVPTMPFKVVLSFILIMAQQLHTTCSGLG